MMISRRWACIPVLLAMFMANGSAATVMEDLKSESRARGIGIVWFSGGAIRIRQFDSDVPRVEPMPGMQYLYDVQNAAGYILGSVRESVPTRANAVPAPPRLALFSLGATAPVLLGVSGPLLAVLSPHADRLAVLIGSGRDQIALKYGDPAWTAPREVYSRAVEPVPYVQDDVAENFSWSPDARKLVYSNEHSVYIFDTQKAISTFLTRGSDPSWSPDGRLIAYVSPEHQLVFIDPERKTSTVVSGEAEVVGFPRWSPDSKFILFSRWDRHREVTSPFRYFFLHDATDLVALRVADGEWAVVFDPGNGSDTRHFFWIQTAPK